MTNSFLSYNVLGDGPSLRAHLSRLQPRTVFYMNAAAEAEWAARTLPNCKVIHRAYRADEDVLHRTPGRTLDYLKNAVRGISHDRIYTNLSTEPQINGPQDLQHLVDEQLAAFAWAKSAGVRVAGPHGAFYGLDERHWPILEPLTTFIAHNPDLFLFTVDEYFAGHGFSGVLDPSLPQGSEIGHIQPETWKASPVPYYYHCGRVTNLFRWLKANNKPLPLTVITEHGADALGDVQAWRTSLKRTPGFSDIRGWQSLQAQWTEWYGPRGWTPERAYLEMMVAVWREIYRSYPNILGACVYAWGSNNDPQWNQFRLDGATEYQARLEQISFVTGAPPVIVTDKPKVTGVIRHVVMNSTRTSSANIRAGASTEATIKGVLPVGETVTVFANNPKDRASGYEWVYVEPTTLSLPSGWVANVLDFNPEYPDYLKEATDVLLVPFLTQRGTGTNNCGPACVAMRVNYGRAKVDAVTVQAVDAKTTTGDAFNGFNDLVKAAAAFGVKLEFHMGVKAQGLRDYIDANGDPPILLVTRGNLPSAWDSFKGNHFVVLVGYGDGWFLIHDPLGERYGNGYFQRVSETELMAAFNALGAQMLKTAPLTPPAPFTEEQVAWLDAHYVRK